MFARSNPFHLTGAIALLLAAGAAQAQEVFTLTDAEFDSRSVTIHSMDASEVTVTLATTGESQQVPLESLVQLARSGRTESVKGLVLCIAGGDRLIGNPQRLEGNSLVWFARGVGEVTVPLNQVIGVLRDRTIDPKLAETRVEDEARLVTGDVVRGILAEVSDQSLSLMPAAGGDPVAVPVESVSDLLLATPPGGRPAGSEEAKFAVRLVSGTLISCKAVRVADSGEVVLDLAYGGAPVKTQLGQILAIEHTAGPVAWLSTRTPLEDVSTPYFGGKFPTQFDRTVTGEPIRIGGVTYTRGIGVHSRSKLVFALTPEDKVFRTRYAIDSSLSYADVDVRVYVDDKVMHERKGVRAGTLSNIVKIDLPAGARTLTLEVDYGQGYDIQDRLTWIEPALIRK